MAQRTIGQGVGFERTARITGYLSSVSRFCNAKQSELKGRVLHGTISDQAASVLLCFTHDGLPSKEAAC